jgi:hypothetical protein
MRSRWLSIAIFACSPLLFAGAPPRAADQQEAIRQFEVGNKWFEAADYEAARVAYQKSVDLVPRGSVFRNLGLAELELGRSLDALKHLRAALAAPDLNDAGRRKAEHDLERAYSETGHLSITTSAGASVSIDGQDVGTAPLAQPLDVTAQAHDLEAHLGAQSARLRVDAKAGATQTVDLTVAVAPPAPPVVPPPQPAVVPPAPAPAEPDHAAPEPAAFWTTRREVGLIVDGASLVAIGVGLYFNSAALKDASSTAGLSSTSCIGPSQPAACSTAGDEHSAQRTDATLNRVFLGVGIAGAAIGTTMFFWPSSRSRMALVPFASPYAAGLQLHGEL